VNVKFGARGLRANEARETIRRRRAEVDDGLPRGARRRSGFASRIAFGANAVQCSLRAVRSKLPSSLGRLCAVIGTDRFWSWCEERKLGKYRQVNTTVPYVTQPTRDPDPWKGE